jgi:Fur family zinc uptake transcriptional regulator
MKNCESHKNCVEDAIKIAEEVCKKQKVKFTNQRKKVLELLWQNHKPVKAYDLLKSLNKADSIQPPIVYRALDFLLENGLAHKINSLNSYIGCSHPLKHKNCYFLICLECKEISECCDRELDHLIEKITDKNKFQLQKSILEISGICKNCQ